MKLKHGNNATWAAGQAAGLAPSAGIEASAPARPASIISDLIVPMLQAAATGAIVAGLIAYIVAKAWPEWGGVFDLWLGLALGIGALTWLLLLIDTRKLLWAIERVIGADLDDDGAHGDPTKRRIEVEVKEGGHRRIIGADWLELDDENLIALAVGLMRGRGLAEGEWIKDKTAFPRGANQFRDVRGKLKEAGLIRLVNPEAKNAGYELTAAGRVVFRKLAKYDTHTPTHTDRDPKSDPQTSGVGEGVRQ